MTATDRQKGGNGTTAAVRGGSVPLRLAPQALPAVTRRRRLVLTKEIYENVLAGNESFLIRPIMNIHGEMRPVPTRARAQGGYGGLLWAFFPHGIHSDDYQLRSCPYGDPNDVLLITTTDAKDLPLTVTVLESYPHRILGTTEPFLRGLAPSLWARLGGVQDFYDYWQDHFGRSFKLAHEPWAWVIRIEPPSRRPALIEPAPIQAPPPNLLGRLRFWRKKPQAQKPSLQGRPSPASAAVNSGSLGAKKREQLIAAQKNALACLENAIKARKEGRAEQGWRMMDVAYRILNRAIDKMD